MIEHQSSEDFTFGEVDIVSYVFPILAVLVTYSYIYTGGYFIPDSLLFQSSNLIFYALGYIFITINIVKHTSFELPRRFLIFCLFTIILGLYQALSLIWTPSFDYGYAKSIRLIFIVSLILGLSILSATSKKRLNIVLTLLMVTGVSVSIAVVVGGQFGYNPSELVGASTYLKTSRPIGIALPIVMYYYLSKDSVYEKVLYASGGFVIFSGLLITGARGPLIASILSTLIVLVSMLVINKETIVDSLEYYNVLIMFLLFCAATVFAYQFFADGRTISRLRPILTGNLDRSTTVRLNWYLASIRFWLEAPIVGHGIGSFEYLSSSDQFVADHRYPHNVFLEVLVELGGIGATLFVGLILTPFRRLYHNIIQDKVSVAVVAVFIYGIINSSLSFDLQSNRILYLCIGISCWLIFQRYKYPE